MPSQTLKNAKRRFPPILDLGCGGDKLPGSCGVDALPLPGVDVVHDLNVLPWPLPDETFDTVRARDVLEHLDDFVGAVKECHRIMRPGGRLTVQMPFAGSTHHTTDPTHKRGATSRTMDYFVEGREYNRKYRYTEPLFQMARWHYLKYVGARGPLGLMFTIADKLLVPLAERHPDAYENHFSGIYSMHGVVFELVRL